MDANKNNVGSGFDEPGMEDGGDIGNLPRFTSPSSIEMKVAESESAATVIINDEGATNPVDVGATTTASTPVADVIKGHSTEVNEASLLTGVLLEHGEAKFNFSTDGSPSYYVKYLDDDKVENVLWGVDLKRALQEAGVEIGQRVEFVNKGKVEVQVNTPVRDLEGNVVKYDLKDVFRNVWEVHPAPELAVKPGVTTSDDLLRMLSQEILAQRGDGPHPQARSTQEELNRVAQHLNLQGGGRSDPNMATLLQPIGDSAVSNAATVGVTAGQSVQMKGGAAIAEGAAALVGGALNLAGTAGKVVGQVAHHVADLMKPNDLSKQADVVEGGLPAVLPRLSEYRIAQVEKAADNFGREADAFWNSSTKLTALRSEMECLARERGLSVQDVAEKMKPGGDFAELREKFNAAVAENPDAGVSKKAMDKALESYVRQYGRAQEELLSPEQNGSPHYDRYKDRLHQAHEKIEQKSSGVPAFTNYKGELEPSHFEKLKEAVVKIMEKLKEVAKEFVAMFRGKSEGDDAPAP